MPVRLVFLAPRLPGFLDTDFEARGLGGSEASLVLLTRELARRGHRVQIFNRQSQSLRIQDVEYAPMEHFDIAQSYETVVLFMGAYKYWPSVKAGAKIFWPTHTVSTDWDDTVFPFASKIIALSSYHARFLLETYPSLSPDRISIVSLALQRAEYFDEGPETVPRKIGNRLIYCSVPKRGLLHLHRLFPAVRNEVPDAELIVTSDDSLWGLPVDQSFCAAFREMPGVLFKGNVRRAELVALQKSAKVMAYPCTSPEAFCLAALECLAAGTVPVTTADYALPTTVGNFGILIPGNPGEPVYDQEFVRSIVHLLKDDVLRQNLARGGRRHVWNQFTVSDMASRFEMLGYPREALR